ncbi:MAG TPA: lytic transglycosylase domain-containing protein [Thermoleophilia bacterium]|nr:lytic transglycosylase domain-containing protein [Thermoleophilia bacterium]
MRRASVVLLVPVVVATVVVVLPLSALATIAGTATAIGDAGAGTTTSGEPPATLPGAWPTGGPPSAFALADIPPAMLALYLNAGPYCPGLPWSVLAAIGRIESDHDRNPGVSSAGARGPMQFLPSTWAEYGIDGDGDGVADIMSPADAIPSAAHYLCANGGGQPATLASAIWNYNHDANYVALVLATAVRYETAG